MSSLARGAHNFSISAVHGLSFYSENEESGREYCGWMAKYTIENICRSSQMRVLAYRTLNSIIHAIPIFSDCVVSSFISRWLLVNLETQSISIKLSEIPALSLTLTNRPKSIQSG